MRFYKLFLLVMLLSVGSTFSNSYANVVYSNRSSIEINVPIDRKTPIKKQRKKLRNKRYKKKVSKIVRKIKKTQSAGEIIGSIILFLLLFLPIAFIIIGGVTGGLGWIIAGCIIMGLWLLLGYLFIITQYSIIPFLGVILCSFFLLACLALFIWALIAILPLILTISIIFGSAAILGFLLMLIMWIA